MPLMCMANRRRRTFLAFFLALATFSGMLLTPPRSGVAFEAGTLPPIVFVARARMATGDYIFPADRGPAGQLTAGIGRFAPGSRLVLRESDGRLRTLIDTARPAGDPLNPLGLRDLQAPDVSFDARRIVFSATQGPELFRGATYRPHLSWRLYEIGMDGSEPRQITRSDRDIDIPDGPGNAEAYSYYDDLFPAYLADGSIVFSSSRYPSRAHYDGRPSFNLYLIDADGSDMRRITTERGGALHPAALPDGRIVFSRWWINFNQPSETGVYSRIDNRRGTEPARDAQGRIITVESEVVVREPAPAATTAPVYTGPPTATPKPTIWPTARPPEQRLTPRPATATPLATAAPRATPAPQAAPRSRTVVVSRPVLGYRLPDGTLVYSNTARSFLPARGRLADGTAIRGAPNTWHLMSIAADGSDLRRFAWTPRYDSHLTEDSGQDSYNAAQPAPLLRNGELLVAYTMQRDGTMAHSTLYTGIRVARPGLDMAAANTVDSIAGQRWDTPQRPPYAVSPAGLPDGRIVFSQSGTAVDAPASATYRFARGGRSYNLTLRRTALRYELWTIGPDGSAPVRVPLHGDLGDADALDAVAVVPRTVGNGPGQWQRPAVTAASHPADNPLEWNTPRGLMAGDGKPAYPWSRREIGDVELVTIENPNIYANPPLGLPLVNNSPPIGSVAFADIYIDANQFSGASYRAPAPDDQVRAVKWLTVPVDAQGRFVASVPADVPAFVVLRDKDGRVVRGGSRASLAIAQGNAPARAGQRVVCVGCHMNHVSGSLDADPLAQHGWTNIAPAARVSASAGDAARATDRRGYVPLLGGGYQDRTAPWSAPASDGAWLRLEWHVPVAVLDVRLTGAEPGEGGAEERPSGEVLFFLAGKEVGRQAVSAVAPLSETGTAVRLPRPLAVDRIEFRAAPAAGRVALSEIEVLGQGATPKALAARPAVVALPVVGR
jgi:hypothetical protein